MVFLRKYVLPLMLTGGLLTSAALMQWLADRSPSELSVVEDQTRREAGFLFARGLSLMGYRNLAASWLWLDFIQYMGDTQARSEVGYPLADDYLNQITDQDPFFFPAYLYATYALAFSAAQPEVAVDILEKGAQFITPDNNPNAFSLYFRAAIIYFLFLGDEVAAREAFYNAADWYEAAGHGSAQGMRDLGDNIINNPLSENVRFSTWLYAYQTTFEAETRELILEELNQLGTVRVDPETGELLEVIPPTPDNLPDD
ncbi:MAG: hypothetical protein HC921_10325 [Synechococcaceae cyanobacterium SM2_3_1]|nr:hypothetical protein [Synechococcaceae cyanobacterium SM2_3_1]